MVITSGYLDLTGLCCRCDAPLYDPEGALSSLNAVISVWLGLHFGHVLKHPDDYFRSHRVRIGHWLTLSAVLAAAGWIIDAGGHEMNKQVWTVSYALFMAGSCGQRRFLRPEVDSQGAD